MKCLHPRRWNIATRVAVLVVLMAIPLLLAAVYQGYVSQRGAQRNAGERLQSRAGLTALLVDGRLRELDFAIAVGEAVVAPHAMHRERADAALATVLASLPASVRRVYVKRVSGTDIAVATRPGLAPLADPVPHELLQRALAAPQFTSGEPMSGGDGRWILNLARARVGADGRKLGLVVFEIDAGHLSREVIDAVPLMEHMSVAMASPLGRVVAATRNAVTPLGGSAAFPEDGLDHLSATRIAGPWMVTASLPVAQTRAAGSHGGAVEVTTLGLIAILAVLLSARLTRHLAGPLRNLRAAAREVATGRFDVQVRVTQDGEVGQLERDFNQMVARMGESEARLKSLLDLSSDWFWEQDAELRFVSIAGNENHRGRWSILSGKVGHRRWEEPFDGITEAQRLEFEAMLQRREPFRDFEFMRPDDDGVMRWISISGKPIFGAAGEFRGYRGTGRDVHERKAAEHSVRESEQRYRNALSAGRMVAWEWNYGDDSPIHWGADCERILGPLPDGQTRYPDFRDMVHADDRERFLAQGRALLEGGQGYLAEFRLRWLDGRLRWIKLQGDVMRHADGGLDRVLGLAQDITERVEAGERLRESEARYRTVLETTTDAVIMMDERGTIDYANAAVESLFGWKPAELAGRGISALQAPAERQAHEQAMARYRATGERRINWRASELTGVHRDGRSVPIEVSMGSVERGGRRFFVAFLRDISARKEAAEQLHRANTNLEKRVDERTAQLQAANQELESFSYTVAHDLRAPLRAIDGFSRMLEEDAGPALDFQSRQYIERIRANTSTMVTMIEELLELSRIGRAEVMRRPVELGPLAREVADEMLAAYPYARVDVGLLPKVEGDRTLLRMVLANLIGNALKFSSKNESPRVEVGASLGDDEVELQVRDNGVGFDPAHAGKLFGVFERLHTRSEFEGTGIGLATVARVVARHGGRVRAESTLGRGATFFFTLPLHAPCAAEAAA